MLLGDETGRDGKFNTDSMHELISVKRVCRMMKARLASCSLSLDVMLCCWETRKREMVERGCSTLIPCMS